MEIWKKMWVGVFSEHSVVTSVSYRDIAVVNQEENERIGGIWNPHFFGGDEVVGGQRWHYSKEWWWFPLEQTPGVFVCREGTSQAN